MLLVSLAKEASIMRNNVMAELSGESSVVCKDPVLSTLLEFLKIDPFSSPPSEGQCPACTPATSFQGPSSPVAAT